MRIQTSWLLPVIAIFTVFSSTVDVRGQSYPPSMGPPSAMSAQPGPGYGAPSPWAAQMAAEQMRFAAQMQGGPTPPGPMPPGAIAPGPMPGGPMPGGPMPGSPMPGGPMPGGMPVGAMGGGYYNGPAMMGGGCPSCGGHGCPHCMGMGAGRGTIDDNFDLNILRRLLPYGAGGICAPRWLDIAIEGLHLTREDGSRRQNFTSQNPLGPTVLSTDNLDFKEEGGLRFTAWLQFGPGGGLDFEYLGGFNWRDGAEVRDPGNNLFSTFSDFGANPPFGFAETDGAGFHQIEYSSEMDGVELNWRRYWQAPNCRVQGSWLLGARYVQVKESFQHATASPNGSMLYLVNTSNSMMGGQIGTDLWITIVPGLRIGGEFKGGLYGTRADSETTITATSIGTPVNEILGDDSFSFVGEAGLMFSWQINQNIAFKGGYQFLYLDGIALAAENFNNGPPFVANQRFPFLNHNGDIFLHGATAGVEWRW